MAGAAAFCGGVTGSVSTAVIAFEVTGQLTHFLPIIVCVLVANLVSTFLGQNLYDSLIELKNLPYLRPINTSNPYAHELLVQDFMNKEIAFIWQGSTYGHLQYVLNTCKHLPIIPVVLSPDTKLLLGTIHVLELQELLENGLKLSATHDNTFDMKIALNQIFAHINKESNVSNFF